VASSSEHNDETSGSVVDGEFVGQLVLYELPHKDSASRS
jgi:hypothetical protein